MQHPHLSMPLLATPEPQDFIGLVPALAQRTEPLPIEDGVYDKATIGLIQWKHNRLVGPSTVPTCFHCMQTQIALSQKRCRRSV